MLTRYCGLLEGRSALKRHEAEARHRVLQLEQARQNHQILPTALVVVLVLGQRDCTPTTKDADPAAVPVCLCTLLLLLRSDLELTNLWLCRRRSMY
ncbi:hypothetical protein GQ600_7568 [Phytophthora cactorum]|nr:hypothetical protein GQ600_7568 [Phytophthora cactorum]